MGCPLQMSELSPGREGRKTLRGNGSGPGCRPALVSLRNRRDTEEETDRRVFGDELLYASVVFFFFLAHPVGEKTNLILDTTDP